MLIGRSPSIKACQVTRTGGFEKSASQVKRRSSSKVKMDPRGIQNLMKLQELKLDNVDAN